MKTALIIIAAVIVGGFIGHSQVLCFNGTCPLTGSWFGGAAIGGVLGFVASGGKFAA